jgi:hypothetical protein
MEDRCGGGGNRIPCGEYDYDAPHFAGINPFIQAGSAIPAVRNGTPVVQAA